MFRFPHVTLRMPLTCSSSTGVVTVQATIRDHWSGLSHHKNSIRTWVTHNSTWLNAALQYLPSASQTLPCPPQASLRGDKRFRAASEQDTGLGQRCSGVAQGQDRRVGRSPVGEGLAHGHVYGLPSCQCHRAHASCGACVRQIIISRAHARGCSPVIALHAHRYRCAGIGES